MNTGMKVMVAVGEVAVAAALSHEVLKSQRYKHSQSTEACAANAKCPLTGPMVKPSVSLLPPSSLQRSEGTASLLCLLSAYSPQGALLSWTVDGAEVNEGVLTSTEEQKNGVYSRSSTLTLSKERWEEAEVFGCTVSHHDTTQVASFRKSRCEVH
ncbi:hypothetical protein KOW79_012551 [Hemibagrus wyckioides]|uniref:Ig-like domain-containing protein n=1 Tax=Hemibagrus wyckioides TaxID=337641 RepID=A0A9D3NM06_9TELE|nr:hypothetical protein KOW79_012551 [Hemibagrus wyckioides]